MLKAKKVIVNEMDKNLKVISGSGEYRIRKRKQPFL